MDFKQPTSLTPIQFVALQSQTLTNEFKYACRKDLRYYSRAIRRSLAGTPASSIDLVRSTFESMYLLLQLKLQFEAGCLGMASYLFLVPDELEPNHEGRIQLIIEKGRAATGEEPFNALMWAQPHNHLATKCLTKYGIAPIHEPHNPTSSWVVFNFKYTVKSKYCDMALFTDHDHAVIFALATGLQFEVLN